MNDVMLFLPWWVEHVNIFPFILDHWIIVWGVSIVVNSYLAGRWGISSGKEDEMFGLIVVILVLPFLVALFLMLMPLIALFAVLVGMVVGLYTLGEKGRRMQ